MVKIPSSTTLRLEAFSDAVIAIAITLLVIEIDVPDAKQGDLFDALARQWPSYAAFLISFVVIGIMWVSHHAMFERIATVDRRLLFLNLMLLLGIGFLPFPTALLATYVREGGMNASVAAAVYSAVMCLIGVVFLFMWVHLERRPHLLVEGITVEQIRQAESRSLVGPIVYGVSIGLAFINAWICFVIYGLIAIYFARGPSSRVATPAIDAGSDADADADAEADSEADSEAG